MPLLEKYTVGKKELASDGVVGDCPRQILVTLGGCLCSRPEMQPNTRNNLRLHFRCGYQRGPGISWTTGLEANPLPGMVRLAVIPWASWSAGHQVDLDLL